MVSYYSVCFCRQVSYDVHMYTVRHFLYTIYKDIAPVDKRYFIAHVLQTDIAQVINHLDTVLSDTQARTLQTYCHRRLQAEPVDTITGTKAFWQGHFWVDKTVLSPRADTETLIEAVIDCCPHPPAHILDMGTGSGCIVISLLHHYPTAQGVAVDISTDALQMAQKNARLNQVDHRLHCIHSDWWRRIAVGTPFDIIVSNPPYIATKHIATLQPEVQKYDPIQALDGGKDGLYAYRVLANMPDGMLSDGGYMAVECGVGQHAQVIEIFTKKGWILHAQRVDLSHIIRVQIYQRSKKIEKK